MTPHSLFLLGTWEFPWAATQFPLVQIKNHGKVGLIQHQIRHLFNSLMVALISRHLPNKFIQGSLQWPMNEFLWQVSENICGILHDILVKRLGCFKIESFEENFGHNGIQWVQDFIESVTKMLRSFPWQSQTGKESFNHPQPLRCTISISTQSCLSIFLNRGKFSQLKQKIIWKTINKCRLPETKTIK